MAIAVGEVIDVTGVVQVINKETGEVRTLEADGKLYPNESIVTSDDGSIAVQMIDGKVVSLGRDSRIVIDNDVIPIGSLNALTQEQVASFESLQQAVEEGGFDDLQQVGDELPDEIAQILEDRSKLLEKKGAEEPVSSSNDGGQALQRDALVGNVTAGFETAAETEVLAREVEEEEEDEEAYVSTLNLAGASTVREGDQILYTLTLDTEPLQPFVVVLEVTNGTAGDEDYTVSQQQVTFQPGQQTATFPIDTIDDAMNEGPQDYTVSILSTTGGGYTGQPDIPSPVTTSIVVGTQEADGGTAPEDTIYFTLVGTSDVAEGDTAEYTVSIKDNNGQDYALLQDAEITFVYTFMTADGNDITQTQTVTVPKGSTSYVLQVPTIDNTTFEGPEQFTVAIQTVDDKQQFENTDVDQTPITTTIYDDGTNGSTDDTPTITIDDKHVAGGHTAHFKATLSEAADTDVVVNLQIANGTAESNDYNNMVVTYVDSNGATQTLPIDGSGNITVPAGIKDLNIAVSTNQDQIFEGTETFVITAGTTVNGNLVTDTGTGLIIDNPTNVTPITIGIDDDRPHISVSDFNVAEGATGSYVVTLSKATENDVTIKLELTNGTAENTDYSNMVVTYVDENGVTQTLTPNAQGEVILPGGRTELKVSIDATQDTVYEGPETVTLTASGSVAGDAGHVYNLVGDTGTATIYDDGTNGSTDDTPSITINDVNVAEGNTANFTATLSEAADTDVVVNLQIANGTAESTDYNNMVVTYLDGNGATQTLTIDGSGNITVPAGIKDLNVAVSTNQDTIFEGPETFVITAGTTINGTLVTDTGTGTILDNNTVDDKGNQNDDRPTITISDFNVAEGSSGSYTVSLSNATEMDTTIKLTLANGTAENNDYSNMVVTYVDANGLSQTLTPNAQGEVVLPAGRTELTVTIDATQDTVYEGPETVTLTAGGTLIDNAGNTITIADDTGTATIYDDGTNGSTDDTPSISVSSPTVTEGTDAYAEFTISLSNASDENVVFTPALANGTNADANKNAVIGTDTGATANLQYFDTTDSTWKAVPAGGVQIDAGDTSVKVRTSVTDDSLYEVNENFNLTATVTSGSTTNSSSTGTATIIDDDVPAKFSVNDVSISEGKVMTFTVTRTGDAQAAQKVDFATSIQTGDSAEAIDFTAASGTLTFNAGETTKTFTVTTTSDVVFEGHETFTVTLSNPTNGATIDDGTGVGAIIDDGTGALPPGDTTPPDNDKPTISVSDFTVAEGNSASYTVTLSKETEMSSVIKLTLANGTAESNDYSNMVVTYKDASNVTQTLTPNAQGEVTLPAGRTELTVTIDTTNDSVFEGPETVTLTAGATLTDAESNVYTIANDTGIGTILDDNTADDKGNQNDDRPEITVTGFDVAEGGTGYYTVDLSKETEMDVTVKLTLTNVTAESNDYNNMTVTYVDDLGATQTLTPNPQGEVVVPAGITQLKVGITATNNTVYEGPETVKLTAGGTLVDNAGATVTIANDDALATIYDDGTHGSTDDTPTVTINDVTVAEGRTAEFDLTLSEAADTSVVVNLQIANGTAESIDYGSMVVTYKDSSNVTHTLAIDGSGNITVPKDIKDLTVSVSTAQDAIFEGPENFVITAGTTVNGTLVTDTGTGTILDNNTDDDNGHKDNDLPVISVTGFSVSEGNTGTFTVNLSKATEMDVSLDLSLTNISTTNSDYSNMTVTYVDSLGATQTLIPDGSGVVVLPAGRTELKVSVDTSVDTLKEGDEKLNLAVSGQLTDNASQQVNLASANADGTITDGVSVVPSVVSNVQEDDLRGANLADQVDTDGDKSLGVEIGTGSTLAYDISFKANDYPAVTKDGVAVQYTLSGDGKTLTAHTGDVNDPVFVVTINNTNRTYKFDLHKTIDHPDTAAKDSNALVFKFDVKVDSNDDGDVIDAQDISTPSTFTVNVEDSVPDADGYTHTTDEDNAGAQFELSGSPIDAANSSLGGITLNDAGITDGKLYIKADGTLSTNSADEAVGYIQNINNTGVFLFKPSADFSGTVQNIAYDIQDDDGDSASNNLSIVVNPESDKPTVTTDAANVNVNEDNSVALGFNAPTVADNTDKSTFAGDYPEKLGPITLSGIPDGAKITKADGTVIFTGTSSDGNVTISLSDATNHINGVSSDVSLTIAEFEGLKIEPPAQSGANMSIDMTVIEYEVDASGNPIDAVNNKASETKTVAIDVQAITDDVPSLTLSTSAGVLVQNEHGSPADTLDVTMDEDTTVTLTNNLVEAFVDADGSEKLWYEITGLEPGTVVTIGSQSYTANASGTVTSEANKITIDEANENPIFTLRPPSNFSGDMEDAVLTLKVQDTDSDSSGTPVVQTEAVYLDVHVNPKGADVSMTTPSETNEDTATNLFGTITVTDTNGAATESITRVGVLKSEMDAFTASGGELSGTLGVDYFSESVNGQDYYVWKTEAAWQAAQITPPAHSSLDVTFTYVFESTDGTDTSSRTQQSTIVVKPVAEQYDKDNNNAYNDTDGNGTDDIITQGDKTYTTTVDEDQSTWYNLNGDHTLSVSNEDTSEVTQVKLWGVPTGTEFTVDGGTTTLVVSNSNEGVTISASDIGSLQVKPPLNVSGNFTINMSVVTTDVDEDAADSTTSLVESSEYDVLTLTITPEVDEVTVSIEQSFGNEDAGRANDAGDITFTSSQNGIPLEIDIASKDNDGSEVYDLLMSDIPDGAAIYYDGYLIETDSATNTAKITYVDGTEQSTTLNNTDTSATFNRLPAGDRDDLIVTENPDGTWSLQINNFDHTKPMKIVPVHNSNENVDVQVQGRAVEQEVSPVVEGAWSQKIDMNVVVKGVADNAVNDEPVDTVDITDTTGATNSYHKIVTEDSGAISLSDLLKDQATNPIASNDGDGSETLFITITNVPDGFNISGAKLLDASASGTSREWIVESGNFSGVSMTMPSHYSGEVDFSMSLQTYENDGDRSTPENLNFNLLVTPELSGDSSISSGTTQQEDTVKTLDFGFSNGGDSNEKLTHFRIDMTTVPAGIELKLDGVTLVANDGNYATIPVKADGTGIDGVVTSHFKASEHDTNNDYNFTVEYRATDDTTDGSNYQDTSMTAGYDDSSTAYTQSTYTVTVSAVTDTATSSLGTVTEGDGDGEVEMSQAGNTITVTDNTSLDIPITLTPDDMVSEGSNGADTDGSEKIKEDKLITISGVPEGVVVVGGKYKGDIFANGQIQNSGEWEVDITTLPGYDPANMALDADGATFTLPLKVSGETVDFTNFNSNGITVTYQHADTGGDSKTHSQTIVLDVDAATFGDDGTGNEPDTTQSNDFGLTTVPNTNLEEDTDINLDTLITVDDGATTGDSSRFAITLTNLEGISVTGANVIEKQVTGQDGTTVTFYSIEGTGNAAAIQTALAGITLTPDSNANVNNPNGSMANVDVTVTTYTDGMETSQHVNLNKEVAPVSDKTSIDVTTSSVAESATPVAQTITIDLSNAADGSRTIIKDGKVYVKFDDAFVDDGTGGTIQGTLTYNGAPVPLDGTEFEVTGITDLNTNIEFQYTPPANHYGSLTVDTRVETKEDPLTSGYATSFVESTNSQTINITRVDTGLSNFTASISGQEDQKAALNVSTATLADPTESVSKATLTNIPFDYEVYYDGVKQTGDVIGKDGSGNYIYSYDFNSVSSVADLSKIELKPTLQNVSGDLTGATLTVVSGEGGTGATQTQPVTISFAAAADDIMNLSPTDTFGGEAKDTPLNFNMNLVDTDGSETVSFTLKSLGDDLPDGAVFKADGVTIPVGNVSYDAATKTYTVTGVSYDDINKITIATPVGYLGINNVEVEAWTVESSNGDTSTKKTGTFELELSSLANGFTGTAAITTTSTTTVAASGFAIPILISGIDMVDKGGSERMVITLKGLGAETSSIDISNLSPDARLLTGGNNYKIILDPSDATFDADLAKLSDTSNPGIQIITSTESGAFPPVTVELETVVKANGRRSDEITDTVTPTVTMDPDGTVTGTGSDETLQGNSSNETLDGDAGQDILYGGAGNDVLIGEQGVDLLYGESGTDHFKIASNEDSTDRVRDFEDGVDKLDLSDVITGDITSGNLSSYLTFNSIDADGDGQSDDLEVTIDSNGAAAGQAAAYKIVLENTDESDIDENDIID